MWRANTYSTRSYIVSIEDNAAKGDHVDGVVVEYCADYVIEARGSLIKLLVKRLDVEFSREVVVE